MATPERKPQRTSDVFMGSYSALSNAAASAAKGTAAVTAHAAKGTAALTTTAFTSTYHATEYAAKGTVNFTATAAATTYHATGSSVTAMATTTKNYTGKFQSTVKQSMSLTPSKGSEPSQVHHDTGESREKKTQVKEATKQRTAAERQQDVRADHVIFDTATKDGRAGLQREAVALINANTKLRETLAASEGTRAKELQHLLKQYQSQIARYEGNMLSTVQAGAEGQERLDLAGHAASDMANRLKQFSASATQLATSVEELRSLTRPLELAESHIGASMGKLEHLAVLVENVRLLRDLALTASERAQYYDSAVVLVGKCHTHWSQLISCTSIVAPAHTKSSKPIPPDANRKEEEERVKKQKAEEQFAAHPRLFNVRKTMLHSVEAVSANCRTEFKTSQHIVSCAARELVQRLIVQEASTATPAPAAAIPSADSNGADTAAASKLTIVDAVERMDLGEDLRPLPVVALDIEGTAAVRAAARAVEALGPALLQEIVMGFVRSASNYFCVQWTSNDANPDAVWMCSQFEEALCAIEALVESRVAEMAAVFPASWGVPRVLLLAVLKEARQSLNTRLAQLMPGMPRYQANVAELYKMQLIAKEFESVCNGRFAPPLVAVCAEDAPVSTTGKGGVAEWKEAEHRGLSAEDMKVKGVLSSAFDFMAVSATVDGANGVQNEDMHTAVFALDDLEDIVSVGVVAVGVDGEMEEQGGQGAGFGVGREWGERDQGDAAGDVGIVLSLERWGAGFSLRQTDLGLLSLECLLLSTELSAGLTSFGQV